MLKDKINGDFKTAFKAKSEIELSILKMLKAAILNKEKNKQYESAKAGGNTTGITLTDEETTDVIVAEIKKLRDSLALFTQGGRADLADKTKEEINILSRYLPEQLSDEEIKKLIAEAVKETGAATIKDMGKVMAILVPKIKGRADNSLVSKLVKGVLQ